MTLKVEEATFGDVTVLRRGNQMILLAPYGDIDAQLLDIYEWTNHEYQFRTVGEIPLDGVSRMIQITLV